MRFKVVYTLFLLGGVQIEAQAQENDTDTLLLPYGPEYGDLTMAPVDDGYYTFILNPPHFPFLTDTYTKVYISTNGILSFDKGILAFNPICSPMDKESTMISPYWSDIQLYREDDSNQIYYRQSFNTSDLQRLETIIKKTYPISDLKLEWAFITTWYNVTMFGICENVTAPRNTFQAILATDGVESWTIFNYLKLEWTMGRVGENGGNCQGLGGRYQAIAGFDFGDGITFHKIRGSCTPQVLQLQNDSNINHPGRWVFQVDRYIDDVQSNACNDAKELKAVPNFVSPGALVELRGPCINKDTNVTNIQLFNTSANPKNVSNLLAGFKDIETYIQNESQDGSLFIIIPSIPEFTGRLLLKLNITRNNRIITYETFIYTTRHSARVRQSIAFDNSTVRINTTWDTLLYRTEKVDLLLALSERSGETVGFVSTVDNLGSFSFSLSKEEWNPIPGVPESFEVDYLIIDILPLGLIPYNESSKLPHSSRSTLIRRIKIFGENVPNWNNDDKFFAKWKNSRLLRLIRETTSSYVCWRNKLWDPLVSRETREVSARLRCESFYRTDPGLRLNSPGLESCPPTLSLIERDARFDQDSSRLFIGNEIFLHHGMYKSYRQRHNALGIGNQCVYDGNGELMIKGRGKGSLDVGKKEDIDNMYSDVLPYCDCCEYSNNCWRFDVKRPSDYGSNFQGLKVPRITQTIGDPHITTFDGLSYTFNGAGEFWMVNSSKFQMQVRFEPIGEKASGASSYVMSNRKVRVQIDRGCQILLDGKPIDFPKDEGTELFAPGGVIIIRRNSCYQVNFMDGHISFTFSTIRWGFLNMGGQSTIINEPVDFQGLMGTLNGYPQDDLTSRNGKVIPRNSSGEHIHYDFGMSWLIYEDESLFTYKKGENYSTFYKPDFRPFFQIPVGNLTSEAIQVCGNSSECLFDFAATGDIAFANATGILTRKFKEENKLLEHYRNKPRKVEIVPIKVYIEISGLPENDFGLPHQLKPDPYLKVYLRGYHSLSWKGGIRVIGEYNPGSAIIEYTTTYQDKSHASWYLRRTIPYFLDDEIHNLYIEVWDEDVQHDDHMYGIDISLDSLLKPEGGKVDNYTQLNPASLYSSCCDWGAIAVKAWVVQGYEFEEGF